MYHCSQVLCWSVVKHFKKVSKLQTHLPPRFVHLFSDGIFNREPCSLKSSFQKLLMKIGSRSLMMTVGNHHLLGRNLCYCSCCIGYFQGNKMAIFKQPLHHLKYTWYPFDHGNLVMKSRDTLSQIMSGMLNGCSKPPGEVATYFWLGTHHILKHIRESASSCPPNTHSQQFFCLFCGNRFPPWAVAWHETLLVTAVSKQIGQK